MRDVAIFEADRLEDYGRSVWEWWLGFKLTQE